MKFTQVLAILAATASASKMRACTGVNMNGSCSVQSSPGKGMGSWNSYDYDSSDDRCFKLCNGCDEVASGCQDSANGSTPFDKFLIFPQSKKDGADCC